MKSTEVFYTSTPSVGTNSVETWLYSEVFFVVTTTATSTFTFRESSNGTSWTNVMDNDLVIKRNSTGAETFKVAYLGTKRYVKLESTDGTTAVAIGCGTIHAE